jgi:hypothetical protein
VKCKNTTTKTFRPALTETSSNGRWIGAYSIGLAIPGKLGCPIKKKKLRKKLFNACTLF